MFIIIRSWGQIKDNQQLFGIINQWLFAFICLCIGFLSICIIYFVNFTAIAIDWIIVYDFLQCQKDIWRLLCFFFQLNFFYSNSGNSIGRFAGIGLVNFCCLFPVFFNSSSISHITVENCKEYYLTAGQITAISTFPFEISNQNSEYFNWLNSIDNTNLPFVQIYC